MLKLWSKIGRVKDLRSVRLEECKMGRVYDWKSVILDECKVKQVQDLKIRF